MRWQKRMLGVGKGAKVTLGLVLVVATAILTGSVKSIDTALVTATPDWLTAISTRF